MFLSSKRLFMDIQGYNWYKTYFFAILSEWQLMTLLKITNYINMYNGRTVLITYEKTLSICYDHEILSGCHRKISEKITTLIYWKNQSTFIHAVQSIDIFSICHCFIY